MVMPVNLLEKSLNKRLSLMLKDGRVMDGRLIGYDEHMNLVLEDTEEECEGSKRRLGTVILRGNNITRIALLQ